MGYGPIWPVSAFRWEFEKQLFQYVYIENRNYGKWAPFCSLDAVGSVSFKHHSTLETGPVKWHLLGSQITRNPKALSKREIIVNPFL
jgi:hypothetical protein